MHERLGLIGLLLALPCTPASAQGAADWFTEGHEILDEWMSFRHVVHEPGEPPLVLGWWWAPNNSGVVRVRGYVADGSGELQHAWSIQTPSSNNYTSGLHSHASCVGDFTGDGRMELAVANGNKGWVWALRGEQAPAGHLMNFDNPFWDSSPNWVNPLAIVAIDIDGDGIDDIVTATPHALRVHWSSGTWLHNVHTQLLLPVHHSYPLADRYVELAVGELDGDPSRKELAVLTHDTQPGMQLRLYHTSATELTLYTTYFLDVPHSSHLAIGDVDGSGLDDIVIFGTDGLYQVLRQTEPGVLDVGPRVPGGPSTHLLDVNGDGFLDGVCCGGGGGGWGAPAAPPNDQPSTFRVALNDGTGGFAPAAQFPGLGSRRIAGAVDIDGDGDLDLIGGRMVLFNHLEVGARYCESAVNSTGDPALIDVEGTASIQRADLQLTAQGLPPGNLGKFYYGDTAVQQPFGDGFRCVGGQIFRLAIQAADAEGSVAHALQYDQPRQPAGLIQAGSTWNFQYWYRDPVGPSGFNFSDAMRITFGP